MRLLPEGCTVAIALDAAMDVLLGAAAVGLAFTVGMLIAYAGIGGK